MEGVYKARISKENEDFLVVAKILKVKEGVFCIDFIKKDADIWEFMDLFKKAKEFLSPFLLPKNQAL